MKRDSLRFKLACWWARIFNPLGIEPLSDETMADFDIITSVVGSKGDKCKIHAVSGKTYKCKNCGKKFEESSGCSVKCNKPGCYGVFTKVRPNLTDGEEEIDEK